MNHAMGIDWGVLMGPSLADKNAHHDIHDAAHTEMEAGTEVLLMSVSSGDDRTALRVAFALTDGWRQRVLAHADAEEEDLFPQVLARFPAQAAAVAALRRDHELLRLLVGEVRQVLEREGKVTPSVLSRFSALLHLQRLHSDFEEQRFLPEIATVTRSSHRSSKEE